MRSESKVKAESPNENVPPFLVNSPPSSIVPDEIEIAPSLRLLEPLSDKIPLDNESKLPLKAVVPVTDNFPDEIEIAPPLKIESAVIFISPPVEVMEP